MGDVKGRSGKLAASAAGSVYTDVGGCKDVSFAGATNTIDVTDMDSGEWEEHLVGHKNVTMSGSGNWDEADAGLMIVHDAWKDGNQVYLRWRPTGDASGVGKEYIALGTITKFEESQAHDGAAEVSFDMMVTGSVTIQTQP